MPGHGLDDVAGAPGADVGGRARRSAQPHPDGVLADAERDDDRVVAGEQKEVAILVKADVQGSAEAIQGDVADPGCADALFAAASGQRWTEGRVLERYELLYEAGLVAEAARDLDKAVPSAAPGLPMVSDHRRILPIDKTAELLHAHPDVAHHPDADWPAGVAVRADATLGRADVLVDLDEGVLDLRVEPALQRLGEVLA